MAKYEITAPDGNKYEITAPDNASEQQVLEYARQNYKAPQNTEVKAPTFIDAMVGNSQISEPEARAMGYMSEEDRLALGAGIGNRAVDMYSGAKQLFSSPAEAEKIAQERAAERRAFENIAKENNAVGYFGAGRAIPDVVAMYLAARGLPSGGKLPLFGRLGYAGGVGAGLNAGLNPTVPEGQGGDNLPWYSMEAETKLGQAGKGFLFGTGGQLIAEGVLGLTNRYLGNQSLRRKYKIDERTGKPYERAADSLEDASGQNFRISERFGGRQANADEAWAAANAPDIAEQEAAKRSAGIKEKLTRLFRNLNREGAGSSETMSRVKNIMDNEYDLVDKGIKARYGAAVKYGDEITQGKAVIITAPAKKRIEQEILKLEAIKGPHQTTLDDIAYLKEKLAGLDDGVSFSGLDSWIRGQTAEAKGTGRMLADAKTEAARRMSNIVDSAVDEAASWTANNSNNPALRTAMDKYLNARKAYAQGEQYLSELGKMSVGKLLDLPEGAVTTDKVVAAVSKKDADEVRKMLKIIDRHDPSVGDAVRGEWLKAIVEKSKPKAGTYVGEKPYVDLKEMSNNMKLDKDFMARFGKHADRDQIVKLKLAIDRLAQEKVARGMTSEGKFEQGMSAAIGGHKVFIAKALIRGFTPEKMGKALLTPEGRQAIITAADRTADPKKIAIAIETLKNIQDDISE